MMDSRIIFHPPIEMFRFNGAEQFVRDVSKHYDVEIPENKSGFDGLPEMGDVEHFEQAANLFTLIISYPFVHFVMQYLVKEAGKYVFKEWMFKPFLLYLEKFKSINPTFSIDRLVFRYDDITIWVGYARKNHINVVSLMSTEIIKQMPHFRTMGLGDPTLIASPVIFQNSAWYFASDINKPILDFFQNWGLEFNNNEGNRLVYNVPSGTHKFNLWQD
jgi:hypothetical protein